MTKLPNIMISTYVSSTFWAEGSLIHTSSLIEKRAVCGGQLNYVRPVCPTSLVSFLSPFHLLIEVSYRHDQSQEQSHHGASTK